MSNVSRAGPPEGGASLRALIIASGERRGRHIAAQFRSSHALRHRIVCNAAELRASLPEQQWDMVICECEPARFDPREALAILRGNGGDVPLVVIADDADEAKLAAAYRLGVEEVLGTDELGRLPRVAQRLVHAVAARRERDAQGDAGKGVVDPLGALLESSPDAVLAADAGGRIVRVNRHVQEVFGYAPVELAGQPIELLVPESVRARHVENRERYAAEPRVRRMGSGMELSGRRKDGSEFPVEISLSPMAGKDGGTVCAVRGVRDRVRSDRLLRQITEGTASATGEQFMRTLTRTLAEALGVRYAYVGELVGRALDRAKVIALWNGREHAEPFEYALPGTPCRIAIDEAECFYPSGVQALFPEDRDLVTLGVDSYLGIRLRSSKGEALGLLTVMHTGKLEHETITRPVLRIFAARAGAELERLRVNAALERSERRFARTLDSSPVAILVTRFADGRILNVNAAACELFGFEAQEMRGRTTTDLGLWADAADRGRVLERLRATGSVRGIEHPIRRKSGDLRMIRNSLEVIDLDGEQCIVGSMQDVTEARQAADALRESEARFRSLTEMSSDFYWETDIEHRLTQRSSGRGDSALSALAYGSPMGKRGWEIPYLAPDETGWRAHRAMLDAHLPFRDFEFSRPGAGGSAIDFSASGDPMFDSSGAFIGYRGVGSDVTDRKRADRLLRQITEGTASATGEEFMRTLTRSLAGSLGVRYAFIGEFTGAANERVRVKAFWNGLEHAEPFEYPLAGAPCGVAADQAECFCPSGVQDRFPQDECLVRYGIDSYLGIRLQSSKGEPLGLLTVMHTRKLEHEALARSVLRIFAARAGAEIERLRATEALERSERRFGKAFRSSPLAVVLTRLADGRVLDLNDAACQLFGHARDEAVGRSTLELGFWADPKERERAVGVLPSAGSLQGFEHRIRRKSGEIRVVQDWLELIELEGEPCIVGSILDVTEAQRAAEALRASEARFRATFEQAAVGVAHVGTEGAWLRVNQRLCDIVGYTREELLARTFQDITHPDDLDADLGNVRQMLAGEISTYSMEKRYVRKDGELVWINLTAALVRKDSGEPDYFISVIEDITVRKGAEAALRESEARFRDLSELSSDWYWEQDQYFRFVEVKDASTRLSALRARNYVGNTRWEAYAECLAPEQWAAHRRQVEAHQPFRDLEYSRRSKDGHTRWVSVSGQPIVDDEGRFKGYRGVGKDVTAQKLAEAALRESEARSRAAFDQAAVGMALREIEGRFLDVNQKLCAMLGYSREELLELTSVDITREEERRRSVEFNRRLRRGELTTYAREKQYLRKDGTALWVNLSINVVKGPDGKPDYVIAVIEDISERKHVEGALRASEMQLNLVTENIPAAVAYVGRDLSIQVANRRYAELHCGAGAQVIGRHLRGVVGEKAWPEVARRNARVFAGEPAVYERTLERPDGEQREIEVHLEPDRSAGGEVRGYYAFVLDVTERKQAEETRARLAAVVETSSDAIVSRAPDGTIQSWNEGARRIFGYTAAEAVGKDISLIAPPEFRHESRHNTRLLQEGKSVPSFETVRIAKGGRRVLVQISVSAIHDHAGNVTSVAAIFRDITERRRAEEALRASELQLRLITENIPAAVAHVGRDLVIRLANPRYVELFFKPGTEAVGRHVRETVGESAWPETEPRIARVLGGEILEFQRSHERPDGMQRTLEVHLQPDRSAGGEVRGYYAFILDITERERAEEALRLRDRALEASVNAVMITDASRNDNPIVYVNPAYERNTGYRASEVLGRNPRFLQGTDTDQPGVETLRTARREEREATALLRNYRKDGTQFWNELRIAPVRDQQGGVTHFVGVQNDVTERIQMQEQLRKLNAELEERVERRTAELQGALRDLETFTSAVSHDLRSPARRMAGFAAILREELGADAGDETLRLLEVIEANAEEMGVLVEALLRLARISHQALVMESVSLAALAREAWESLDESLPRSRVELRLGDLPVRRVDRVLMRQLLVNLMGNAVKFSAHSERPMVDVGVGTVTGEEVFHVRDNGAGFDMAYAQKLFKPFSRLHARAEFEGTGIGLSIVELIVRRHGGRVWAEGVPGQGAAIHFSLGRG